MRKKGTKKFRYDIDVINQHCREGKSTPEIAKIIGCNYWNLLAYLKRNFVCIQTKNRLWTPKKLADNHSDRDKIKTEIWGIFYSAFRENCLNLVPKESKDKRAKENG